MSCASNCKRLALALVVATVALSPHVATAGLGAPEASVTADALQLKGSLKTTERTSYRVHDIQLPSGTLLREFAGPDGNVFAVAWHGPRIPNLRQALGDYFGPFSTALKTHHSDHTHAQVRQGNLVVESYGHMRAFSGRAYLPQAMPAGTSLEDIR